MTLKFVDEIELKDKKVIARFDFNVPFAKDGSGTISDTTRVDRAMPTIKHILDKGAKKLVLMSHLGRPKGKPNPEFSLEPVAKYLSDQLGMDVVLTESCTDGGIKNLLNLPENKVILLQNLRFHKEETDNDPGFAKTLAGYGEIFVNDAFGTCHRKHASTYGIVENFKGGTAVGGFLLKQEIKGLGKVVESPAKPFVAIIGGAKVSDKIKIIERLLVNVDKMIIGGAMSYPFLKAKGHKVGKSLCSDEDVELATKILHNPASMKIYLPIDHVVSNTLEDGGDAQTINDIEIPDDLIGLDIGPASLDIFAEQLQDSKTVLWNGPMGLFENKLYAKGTIKIAEILSTLDAFTCIGGGDSVSAVKKAGLTDKMSHVSTGGGASLEFLEDGTLPGIQALKF